MTFSHASRCVLLITPLVLLAGCDWFRDSEEPASLMPLEVGNTWTFEQQRDEEDSSERYTLSLVGTQAFDSTGAEQLDGHTFYTMKLRFEDRNEQQNFIREISDGLLFLYYFDESGYKESTFFQYPVDGAEEYEYTDVRGLPFTYTVDREIIETPAGTFVVYTYSGYDASGTSISFAPDIGPVRLTESDSEALLVEYNLAD